MASRRARRGQASTPTINRAAPVDAENDYCGAVIHDVRVGPRRELTLRIERWPKGKSTFQAGDGDLVTLRFGAISNYAEVQGFFATAPTNALHYLRDLSESKVHRRVIEMEFDRTGDRIKIIARNVSAQASESL